MTVWDGRTGRPFATLRGHTAPVHAAAFGGKGSFLATASELAGGLEVSQSYVPARPNDREGKELSYSSFSVELVPDNSACVFQFRSRSGRFTRARLIDLATNKDLREFAGIQITDSFRAITFGPNDMMAYHDGKDVVIHDLARKQEVFRIPDRAGDRGLLFSPAGDRLAILGETPESRGMDSTCVVWDLATKSEVVESRRVGNDVNGVARWGMRDNYSFDGQGKPQAVWTRSSKQSSKDLWRFYGPAGDEYTVRVARTDSNYQLERAGPPGHAALAVTQINIGCRPAVSPDGRRIACVGQNAAVVVLDARTLEELMVLATPVKVDTLAFSLDGKTLVGATMIGSLYIWSGNPPAKP